MMEARPKKTRRAAIYARLSVTTEESVSIHRQVEACRRYAEARGWTVALVAVDDGVSATKNRPEERQGWREILDSPESFGAVLVWKVDRLARRVLDFLHADESLRARGAAIVAVEDPIDMTTAQGRAFATMLAVFAEMEAAATSARVSAARRALVHAGRLPGGRPPYGFKPAPNPDGPGYVVTHDPERIDYLREIVRRALAGESTYSIAKWLNDAGAPPRPSKARTGPRWVASSVDNLLKSPLLAGMVPYTPGRKSGSASADVLRGPDGLPIIHEELAVMSPSEWRRMHETLAARALPGARLRPGSDMLLFGIARCDSCGRALHRTGGSDRMGCSSAQCTHKATIAQATLEEHVLTEVMKRAGSLPAFAAEVTGGEALELAEVEAAIRETVERLAAEDDDDGALSERLSTLKTMRKRLRETTPAPVEARRPLGRTFGEILTGADLETRREVLWSIVAEVRLRPAAKPGRGQNLDERVEIVWRHEIEPEADALAGQID